MKGSDEWSHWTLWQMLDSFFPTGGFAHSYGLEAAAQSGLVCDVYTLDLFIKSTLENSGAQLLPFVFQSHQVRSVEGWIQLDRILNATLSNHVARRASSTQGLALLRTSATAFPEIDELKQMRMSSRGERVYSHHATVFGTLCGLLGLDSGVTQRAYLYMTMRDCLSAATRLNLVGPLQAAGMQQRLSQVAESVVKRCADRTIEDANQVAPLLDAGQACHDLLFSRLFCS